MLPCFTTPATTPEGRKAPKSAQGKMSTPQYNRWVSDGRAYAPWRYDQDYMLVDTEHRYQLLPADTKESLHHLPVGYTAGFDEKLRHKWIANSWRVGVARLLILLLLLQPQKAEAAEVPGPLAFHQFEGLEAIYVNCGMGRGPMLLDLAPHLKGQVERSSRRQT